MQANFLLFGTPVSQIVFEEDDQQGLCESVTDVILASVGKAMNDPMLLNGDFANQLKKPTQTITLLFRPVVSSRILPLSLAS